MNNKNILIYILIGVVLLITIFIVIITITKKSEESSKKLELTYEINAGIPYRWEFEIGDESVVEYVKRYVVKDENKGGLVGGKVTTNYVFKGLKEGKTTITFKMVNITGEREDTTKEVHTVKVDEDLNISLVKSNE